MFETFFRKIVAWLYYGKYRFWVVVGALLLPAVVGIFLLPTGQNYAWHLIFFFLLLVFLLFTLTNRYGQDYGDSPGLPSVFLLIMFLAFLFVVFLVGSLLQFPDFWANLF